MADSVGTGDRPVPGTDRAEAGTAEGRSGKAGSTGQQDDKPTGRARKAGGKARKTTGRAAKSRSGGRADPAGRPDGGEDPQTLRGLVKGALSATNSLPPLDLTAGRRTRSAYSAAVLLRPDDGRPGPAIPARPQPVDPRADEARPTRTGPADVAPVDQSPQVPPAAGPTDAAPADQPPPVTPAAPPTEATPTDQPPPVAPGGGPPEATPLGPPPEPPFDLGERRRPAGVTGTGPARDPRAVDQAPSGPPSPRGRPRPGGPRRAARNQVPALIADALAAELGFTPELFDRYVAAGIDEITAGILPSDPLFAPLAGPASGGGVVRPALAEPTIHLPTVDRPAPVTGSTPKTPDPDPER